MISLFKTTMLISIIILFNQNVDYTIQKEDIQKVSYSKFNGGKGGDFSYLEINKDSIYFLHGSRISKTDTIIKKTPLILWKKILNVNIKDFKKVNSGKRTAYHDGTDTEISLYSNLKKYSFVNGEYENMQNVDVFTKVLEDEISNIRTEIYQSKQIQ